MVPPTGFVDIGDRTARTAGLFRARFPIAPWFYALQSRVTRFRSVQRGHRHAEICVRHAPSWV
jgi:hypothetical protein